MRSNAWKSSCARWHLHQPKKSLRPTVTAWAPRKWDWQTPITKLSKKTLDISETCLWCFDFGHICSKFQTVVCFWNALCPRCCLHGSAASLCLHPLWAPLCLPSLCSGHHPHGTQMSYLPGPGRSRRVDDGILPFFPKNLSCFWDHLAIPVACRWCASWELWTHEDHEARARPACQYGSMEAHLGYDWRFPQTMYCISPGRLFGRAVMKQAKVWTLLFLGLWQVSCVTLSNIWGAKWKIIPVNLYRRQFHNWQKRQESARIGKNPACITALRLCFFLLVLSGQLSGILRWACTPWMAGIADESAH